MSNPLFAQEEFSDASKQMLARVKVAGVRFVGSYPLRAKFAT